MRGALTLAGSQRIPWDVVVEAPARARHILGGRKLTH